MSTQEDLNAQQKILSQKQDLLDDQKRLLEERKALFEEEKNSLSYAVFDDARKRLIAWASALGGIVAVVAGLVGYLSFENVVSRLAGERIEDLTQLQIPAFDKQLSSLESRVVSLDSTREAAKADLEVLRSAISVTQDDLTTADTKLNRIEDQLRGRGFPDPSEIVTTTTLLEREPFILYNLDSYSTLCGSTFEPEDEDMANFSGFERFWILFEEAFPSGARFETHTHIALSTWLRGNISVQNYRSDDVDGNVCNSDQFFSQVSWQSTPFLRDMRELPDVVGLSLARVAIDRDRTGKIVNADEIEDFRERWKKYDRSLFYLGVNGANYTLSNDPDFFVNTGELSTPDKVIRMQDIDFIEDGSATESNYLYAVNRVSLEGFRLEDAFK